MNNVSECSTRPVIWWSGFFNEKNREHPSPAEVFKPNTLVSYKGGGYDGCFWEWNYAWIDHAGNFHNIYASGYKGAKTLDELQERYTDDPDDFGCYDFADKDERERFARVEPVAQMLGILEWLEENGWYYRIRCKCDLCGCRMTTDSAQGAGYRGDGGIGYRPSKLVCHRHRSEFD